ncbi:hypothetical protein FSP39_005970 [Pinctada imbricata]|uniref:Leukotriene-A(4) hydrolase n=1 Tax=Pinctada imbricata TaxID=66713 RepID=A0AA88XLD1_PINIB|nr:hypothetical protein FSP39_005970 [Pinctada imbricata]
METSPVGRLSPGDPCSYSRPDQCILTKLHLELDVSFDKKELRGVAEITVEKKQPDIQELILDAKDLEITRVTIGGTDESLEYTIEDPILEFGSKFTIKLPNNNQTNFNIRIHYATTPKCSALQWLNPKQTKGNRHPYLFSQCQAIHARSLVPCQDSSAVKFPYTAKISAPSAITILMSALQQGIEAHPSDSSKRVHKFEQKVPIPSYLIAIVGGDLESRDLSERCRVWCEKEVVDDAAYEFAETEKMLQVAESLAGPYVWGRYDLLMLPPSFPYGGMENPCLTFVTPTLLAGDRSLADVVAHEITHSWTGNLVTNSSPEHFWLNEGHTVFIERKIAGRLHGEPHRQMMSREGWSTLEETVKVLKSGPFTKLILEMEGIDPDDAFSSLPYEKGSALLLYLERILGGSEVFEPFLKAYIEKFKYQSIDSSQWKSFLYEHFADKKSILDSVDWDGWFHSVGMPPVKMSYDESLLTPITQLSQKWIAASDDEAAQFSADDIKDFSSIQRRIFLEQLCDAPSFSVVKVQALEKLCHFNAVKNSEVRFKYVHVLSG